MELINYNSLIHGADDYKRYTAGITDLKEKAWINFSLIYSGFNNIVQDFHEFEECWNLLTDDERYDFSYNLCYTHELTKSGRKKLVIYFHCYDHKDGYWHDYSLRKYRKIMQTRPDDLEIWDSIGY